MKFWWKALILFCTLLGISGALLIVNLSERARAGAGEVSAQLGEPFTLRLDQWVRFDTADDFGVQFYAVKQDNRCPAELECTRGGVVTIQLGLRRNGQEDRKLYEVSKPVPVGHQQLADLDYRIELLEVNPHPQKADEEISQDQYTITLVVHKVLAELAEIDARLGEPFTLGIGQWAQLSDTPDQLGVAIDELISDSRCPSDANCAVQGQALFRLRLRLNGPVRNGLTAPIGEYTVDEQNIVRFEGYTVELLEVQPPAPKHTEELTAEDYRVTFTVRDDETSPPSTPTATPTATRQPPTDPLPTPISSDKDELSAALGQPFDLRIGQSAKVAEVDFSLTYQSAWHTSGCLTGDCSTMIFVGTLAAQRGDKSELRNLSLYIDSGTPFNYEFTDLTVQIHAIHKLSDDSYVATFVVVDPAAQAGDEQTEGDPPTENRPDGEWSEDCDYFSRFDAAAILQEHVYATSIGNLIFDPSSLSADDQHGLCGFISEAEGAPFVEDDATPRLLTDLESDHVMAAGVLPALYNVDVGALDDGFELRALIESAFAGDENFVDTYLPQIVAAQTVGDAASIIPVLHEAGEENQSLRAESVEGLAEEGIWLWRSFDGGHFSLLLLRNGDKFATVVALLGDHVDDLTVLDYSVIIARRLLEDRLIKSSTPQTDQTEAPNCNLLSADEAAAILGEEVHTTPVNDDQMGCGYVAASGPSPDLESFDHSAVDHGVYASHLTGEEINEVLHDIRETLTEGVTDDKGNAQLIFDTALLAGDFAQAIRLLDNLAEGSAVWQVEELSEVNDATAFLWAEMDDQTLAALITLDDSGDLLMVAAFLPNGRRQSDVRAPLIALAQKMADQAE